MGQIHTEWDKSGTFSDQFSEDFRACCQKVLKTDLKKSQIFSIFTFGDNLTSLGRKLRAMYQKQEGHKPAGLPVISSQVTVRCMTASQIA